MVTKHEKMRKMNFRNLIFLKQTRHKRRGKRRSQALSRIEMHFILFKMFFLLFICINIKNKFKKIKKYYFNIFLNKKLLNNNLP